MRLPKRSRHLLKLQHHWHPLVARQGIQRIPKEAAIGPGAVMQNQLSPGLACVRANPYLTTELGFWPYREEIAAPDWAQSDSIALRSTLGLQIRLITRHVPSGKPAAPGNLICSEVVNKRSWPEQTQTLRTARKHRLTRHHLH
jgi:hypothetical protein